MTDFDLATVDALLSTTRAVRKRLDFERDVPNTVLNECLALSQQAPTGSNMQNWRWMVIRDAAKKAAIAEYYRDGGGEYLAAAAAMQMEGQTGRVIDSANYLANNMQHSPVLVIPCLLGRLSSDNSVSDWAGMMGSIFPAIWSFQLALRSRGLGSCLTTLHLAKEAEVAELLGIPDYVMQVALLPVAYTKGTDFHPAARPPVAEITHWDAWTEASPT